MNVMHVPWKAFGGPVGALVFTSWLASTPVFSQDAPPDPAMPGPYAVGVTQRTFTRLSSTTGARRELPTIIWYPATESATSRAPHTFLRAPMNVGAEHGGPPYPAFRGWTGTAVSPWEPTSFTTRRGSNGSW